MNNQDRQNGYQKPDFKQYLKHELMIAKLKNNNKTDVGHPPLADVQRRYTDVQRLEGYPHLLHEVLSYAYNYIINS